ncbi:MAG TPA: dihydrolipoamide acetyltransferase family protein [Gaiellaceae bacterium]|nr:dihydrolipoamide acetyltransferase family protein [Gaiellaceae bacterium]
MASEVILPRLGQGMEAGTIVRWLKSEGDRVEKGEPLYELDTDKVTQEVEADAAGVLLKIVVPEGEVPVGRTVAFLGEEGEDIPSEAAASDAGETAEAAAAQSPPAERPERAESRAADTAPPATRTNGGRIKASPLARRIARERGIDLAALSGTGPEGRIVAEDVERGAVSAAPAAPARAAAPAAAPAEAERIELTSVRRTIARRLTAAWQVPVFQLQASADMTRANDLVAKLRERDPDVRVTVTDVLTAVSAAALLRHPEVNSQYTDEAILRFPAAHVGIAVAAPQGLVVPVIHEADRLRLAEIAAARSDLVSRAREGKLRPDDLEGGTFTISNLGMYSVERFTAVLNPPQAAIVAVGATEDRVVPVDGGIAVRPMLTLVVTFDHRAVDGAPAAAFLQTLKESLEDPGLAL